MTLSPVARIAAFLVALIAVAGLAIQVTVSLEKTGAVPAALWSMLRFFTIIGNGVTALVLLGAALGLRWPSRPAVLGGVTLIMGLIGVVYATLLRNTEHLVGHAQIANYLMHYAMPAAIAPFWLLLVPKGGLTRIDPLNWALLPLAYFPYALVRAHLDGKYPYPFINVAQLGWAHVLTTAAIITMAFLLTGLAMVWLDRMLGRSRKAKAPVEAAAMASEA
ncbi:Pr6Pr family membrane protein [Sphingobium nicotianae]|uniref:Pr6Pr family membrane protein n=1 Tax=Sphingobium nicotianae TaxID=2782607 RepID=A0A9X1DAK7_9SPHN|nr:Pr6Pr family membrane protein [Sphingobium nicotianae]MBT2186411.1 Pr6Pr family membrane protein [Sphingobium nicotianae]